ncbi:uncharacterized protein G2W53_016317 [Senna tora]|uniref:Uncharacterized protein n=1 Tax=Senna tora TaxID=362788 RepID=A0A834WLE3_9FABA|nr:uncharacterized protein G2W53_016317 [Senna tora]
MGKYKAFWDGIQIIGLRHEASTGQPQQHVEELQHEVLTNPSQQQGTIDSTIVNSSAIIRQGRDPTNGKLWIQPCGQS